MTRTKTPRCARLWTVAVSLLVALPAFAGRPLAIDDAEPVAPGAYELEAGLQFANAPDERHVDLPFGLAYGLAPGLEIGAGWGWHLHDRISGNADSSVSGQQDVALGFKWMPVHTEGGIMLALAGSASLGTASRAKGLGTGDEDYDLTAIATRQWGRSALDVNLGHTWVGDHHDATLVDNVHYGAALRYAANETLTWVGEVLADDPKGSQAQWQVNAGLQYALRDNLVLDASLGRRLGSSGPDAVVNLGLTATF